MSIIGQLLVIFGICVLIILIRAIIDYFESRDIKKIFKRPLSLVVGCVAMTLAVRGYSLCFDLSKKYEEFFVDWIVFSAIGALICIVALALFFAWGFTLFLMSCFASDHEQVF
jgi:hypothetical protein